MSDGRIRIVNDVTGETEIDYAGQTYTVCFDTAAVLALEKMRNDRPVLELVAATPGAIDCCRMLMCGSAGGRRRLRGPGGNITAEVAQAILEEFGPIALAKPLVTSLSHAACLHLYDDERPKAREDADDPLAGLAG